MIHTAVETSDYGIQGNCNSGSIGVYFNFCRDECLRRRADLDRLRDYSNDSGNNSGNDSPNDSGSASRNASRNASGNASDSQSEDCGDLVLGHQFQQRRRMRGADVAANARTIRYFEEGVCSLLLSLPGIARQCGTGE